MKANCTKCGLLLDIPVQAGLESCPVCRTVNYWTYSQAQGKRVITFEELCEARDAKPLSEPVATTVDTCLPPFPDSEKLGIFMLGDFNVEIVLDWLEGGNGSFYFTPTAHEMPRLWVGMGAGWVRAVDVLLHESTEFLLALQNHRYTLCGRWANNEADYFFHYDHQQFARVTSMLASFLVDVMPSFAEAYNKRNPEK